MLADGIEITRINQAWKAGSIVYTQSVRIS